MITAMDEFVQKVRADLVVMASHALSGQVRPVQVQWGALLGEAKGQG